MRQHEERERDDVDLIVFRICDREEEEEDRDEILEEDPRWICSSFL